MYLIPATRSGAVVFASLTKGCPFERFSRNEAAPLAIKSAVIKNPLSFTSLTLPSSCSMYFIPATSSGATIFASLTNGCPFARFSRKDAALDDITLIFSMKFRSFISVTLVKSSTIFLMTCVTLSPALGSRSLIFLSSTIKGAIAFAKDPNACSSAGDSVSNFSFFCSFSMTCLLMISSIDNKTLLLSSHIPLSTFATISVLSTARLKSKVLSAADFSILLLMFDKIDNAPSSLLLVSFPEITSSPIDTDIEARALPMSLMPLLFSASLLSSFSSFFLPNSFSILRLTAIRRSSLFDTLSAPADIH